MIIINSISTEYFSLNGINKARIYQPLEQGIENIGIYNIYDTRQQLVSSTKYDEYQIDGVIYASQAATIAALLNVIWSQSEGGGGAPSDTYVTLIASKFYNAVKSFFGLLDVEDLTANRTYKLPNKSGTFALTDDLLGNDFSYQFKEISEKVWFDAPYVSAKYPEYIPDVHRMTATNVITGAGAGMLEVNILPYSGTLKCTVEARYVSGGLSGNNGLYGRVTDAVSEIEDSASVTPALTTEWQEYNIPLAPSLNDIAQYWIYLSTDAVITVSPGCIIEMRNIVITDELDNVKEALSYEGRTFIDYEFIQGTGSIEDKDISELDGTRLQVLLLTELDEVPTIPASEDLRPGDASWLYTDIMIGETCYNQADDIWYYRTATEIKKFGGVTKSTELSDMPTESDITDADVNFKLVLNGDKSKYILVPSTTSSGFYDPDNIQITFDNTDLVLTGTNKFVTNAEKQFEKTDDSITIVPVNGLMYIYYDDAGNLQQLNNPNRSTQLDQMRITLPVCYLTYNALSGVYTFVGNYLKGRVNAKMWVKNFFDKEVETLTGLAVYGLTGGLGDSNADIQLGLSAGELIFTDNHHIVPTRLTTDKWIIGYLDINLDANALFNQDYLVLNDIDFGIGTTGRAVYNNNGVVTVAGSGNYVWYFIFQTVGITDVDRTAAFMGNLEYSSESFAEQNLKNEVATLEARLVIRQGASIKYGVLIETKSTFANIKRSRIVKVDTIERESGASPTVSIPTDLVNGSDATYLHMHDSAYVRLDSTDRVQRVRQTLSVSTNNIALDWDSKNDLISANQLSVTANATVSFLNAIFSEFADFILNISNLSTITFPSGTISPDENFDTLVWTPPENGIYSFGLRRVGSTYILLVTQAQAI